MKKVLIVLAVAALALPSYAGIITDPGSGALQMTLTYDPAGNATLHNNTGSALDVDGYEILSTGGNLDPVNWESIDDAVDNRLMEVIAELGTGALSFGELAATVSLLAEGNLSGAATFQPAALWSIAQPINPGTSADDLLLYYTYVGGTQGDKYLGVIVPEPVTLALLAFGGLLGLVRRRR